MKKNALKASHLVQSSLGFIITLFAYQNLPGQQANDLWQVYQATLRKAKYVDLTHTVTPTIPVWKGFGPSRFTPTVNPENGQPYNYDEDLFAATAYQFSTDQLGTQLDPPAHWNPDFPSIDELPPTFAVRPLVVISIVAQVAKNPKYALQVQDILDWEKRHGKIPEGSVKPGFPWRLAGRTQVSSPSTEDFVSWS